MEFINKIKNCGTIYFYYAIPIIVFIVFIILYLNLLFLLPVFLLIFFVFFLFWCVIKKRGEFKEFHMRCPIKALGLILFCLFVLVTLLVYIVGFGNIFLKTSYLEVHVTILSIIIALTVLSIELNANKYSFRIIEYFKNLYEVWIFCGIFFFAILVDLYLSNCQNSNDLLYYFLNIYSIFTIYCVFPYFWEMLVLMRPENMMQKFVLFQTNDVYENLDRILTILGIINNSIRKREIPLVFGGVGELEALLVNLDVKESLEVLINNNYKVTSEEHFKNDIISRIKQSRILIICIQDELKKISSDDLTDISSKISKCDEKFKKIYETYIN
jgi:hypothetical protein